MCYIFQQDEVFVEESNQGQAIGFWIFCQTLWLNKKNYISKLESCYKKWEKIGIKLR